MSCVPNVGPQFSYKVNEAYERSNFYPYEIEENFFGSDVKYLVLGPDVIASIDGEKINWRGVWYDRHEPVLPPDPYEKGTVL